MPCFHRKRAVTSFIFARKYTTAGIWKIRPIPSSIFVYSPKTSLTLGMKARSGVLNVAKNRIMNGNAM
ncbi:hypothetical protein D3C83_89410 [compost metagenome]